MGLSVIGARYAGMAIIAVVIFTCIAGWGGAKYKHGEAHSDSLWNSALSRMVQHNRTLNHEIDEATIARTGELHAKEEQINTKWRNATPANPPLAAPTTGVTVDPVNINRAGAAQ